MDKEGLQLLCLKSMNVVTICIPTYFTTATLDMLGRKFEILVLAKKVGVYEENFKNENLIKMRFDLWRHVNLF